MKTLIVDDDFTSRLVLQRLWKEKGEAHVAVNGQEAVVAVEEARKAGEPYEIIFLDIKMPVMDGHEALAEIRRSEEVEGIFIPDGVKIVMLTGNEDSKSILKSFNLACDGYLKKPIEGIKLREQLSKLGFTT